MTRIRMFLMLLALAALGGCATTSSDYYSNGRYAYADGYAGSYAEDGYADGSYYDDGYSSDGYYDDGYSNSGYADSGYADSGYGGGDYYYGEYASAYGSDYLLWPSYYSIFWPMNHWYVDPWYYPSFYYGVTYFPRSYWSVSTYWDNYRPYGWSSYGYWAYSPYRYSWADNYYDWYPWYDQHSDYHNHHSDTPRYGSARNELQRVMALRQSERSRAAWSNPRHAPSNGVAAPDQRGPRAAYYPTRRASSGSNVGASRNSLSRTSPSRTSISSLRNDRQSTIDRANVDRSAAGSRARDNLQRVQSRRSAPAKPLSRSSYSRQHQPRAMPSKPATRSISRSNSTQRVDNARDRRSTGVSSTQRGWPIQSSRRTLPSRQSNARSDRIVVDRPSAYRSPRNTAVPQRNERVYTPGDHAPTDRGQTYTRPEPGYRQRSVPMPSRYRSNDADRAQPQPYRQPPPMREVQRQALPTRSYSAPPARTTSSKAPARSSRSSSSGRSRGAKYPSDDDDD